MYPPYRANMVKKVRYKVSDTWTNDPDITEADPKTGTGKKPKGSDRRLYTDENPKDTVRVKFRTAQDIRDTLSKTTFKSKPHARQSQIINLIHQRVRAAYNNAKPPRPPYRNTMINVVVLGCAPIQTGEGAAAPFIGVHILGKIRPAGGVCYPGRIAMGGPN